MSQSKWPGFLFAIGVRFVCGMVLGGVACLVLFWRGILEAFSRDDVNAPLVLLGLGAVLGGIIAMFTVPRWQRPWYRRDSEMLDLGAAAGVQREDRIRPGSPVVTKSVTIKLVGEDGVEHEYSSMEEVPPEVRSEIEALEKEALQGQGTGWSVTERSETEDASTLNIMRRKNVSVYRVVDESGAERIYHSLEEMPVELRALIEQGGKDSE